MTVRMLGEKFYLVEELKDILPLSSLAIRKYIRNGKLRGVRIGKFWYVSNDSVKDFLTLKAKILVREVER